MAYHCAMLEEYSATLTLLDAANPSEAVHVSARRANACEGGVSSGQSARANAAAECLRAQEVTDALSAAGVGATRSTK